MLSTIPLLLAALLTISSAAPVIDTSHSYTPTSSQLHNIPQTTKAPTKDPIFHITAYEQHTSPTLNSVKFHFADPRLAHRLSVDCTIPGSDKPIYKENFTSCGNKEDKLSFRIKESEVEIRRGWMDGDQSFVGYAPQKTYWSEEGLTLNRSLTFDGGVTFWRTEDWWFPAKVYVEGNG
ncbi:hypothetical protein K504DRAFT_460773, partial [Pleomassaria siparia CBS 279.74]